MTDVVMRGRPLVAATAHGRVLHLKRPISLWGGVEPTTGRICDPRHPDYGAMIGHRVLVIPAVVGSSSTSAIMLELLRHNCAPAAVVVGNTDAILALGVIVGRELGYGLVPVIVGDLTSCEALESGDEVRIQRDGTIRRLPPARAPQS